MEVQEVKLITTIAPFDFVRQQRAISTWLGLGYDVLSVNSKTEIEVLKNHFPNVFFVETENIGDGYDKPYVRLNAITDLITEPALVINSDIEIHKPINPVIGEKEIIIYQRSDYDLNTATARRFQSGFDAFYLTPEFCKLIPNTNLVIGQCHWDYFIPMLAIKNKWSIKMPRRSHMYHKKHVLAYDNAKWRYTADIFAKELGLSGNAHADSSYSLRLIKSKLKLI